MNNIEIKINQEEKNKEKNKKSNIKHKENKEKNLTKTRIPKKNPEIKIKLQQTIFFLTRKKEENNLPLINRPGVAGAVLHTASS